MVVKELRLGRGVDGLIGKMRSAHWFVCCSFESGDHVFVLCLAESCWGNVAEIVGFLPVSIG